MAFHTGSTAVMVAAQERGKMAVAYHSDMRKPRPMRRSWPSRTSGAPTTPSAPAPCWTAAGKAASVWGGVKEGMIRVGDFGARVPKAVQDEVLARQKDIAMGKLHPFTGPITDNEGKCNCRLAALRKDEQILTMNFSGIGRAGQGRKIGGCALTI
jgi:basic membrane protein A